MDGILALLIVLIVFALFIYMINRSVKTVMAIGIIVVAYLVLRGLGFLG
jgi:hypothetical protein